MDIKNCKYCNEKIPGDSKRCIYCGSILDDLVQKDEQAEESAQGTLNKGEQLKDEQISYIIPANIMTISNGIKVLITSIVCIIPIVGQLFGIIMGLILMTYKDFDRKTFGQSIVNLSILLFSLLSIIMISLVMYNRVTNLQPLIQ